MQYFEHHIYTSNCSTSFDQETKSYLFEAGAGNDGGRGGGRTAVTRGGPGDGGSSAWGRPNDGGGAAAGRARGGGLTAVVARRRAGHVGAAADGVGGARGGQGRWWWRPSV
jgi:hypothetical protein